ncbi:hypothetical protein H6F88_17910 [Oculatella sp. FACHB-28]|uniref:hypothetical protein n=1 Tax=Oculatella sp. FACHB-28 TaxID=2692845 RepID=UPI00168727C4|nr:hypothetical protein [Oculatella sp. FACHB-28]MBD2057872.1 hypothetical protein [Oculatella sp. FACHB-28]
MMKQLIGSLPKRQLMRLQQVGMASPISKLTLMVLPQAAVLPKSSFSDGKSRDAMNKRTIPLDSTPKSRWILRQLCQMPVQPLQIHPDNLPDIR